MSPEEREKRKDLWIDLGLLYKEIDEPEIFQSLYLANVATEEAAIKAINYEIQGEYGYAVGHYKKAENANPNKTYESSLWTGEMLFCFTQLGRWDAVSKSIDESVGDNVLQRIWDSKTKVSLWSASYKTTAKYLI